MIKDAINKINSEISQNRTNSYIQVVGEFLLQHLNTCPESAEKILVEGKTIGKSLDEMRKVAEKKKVGNCAVLTDQEGFAIVLKYYDINGNAPISIPLVKEAHTLVATKAPEKKASIDFDVSLDDFLV
jgi:hypothetical protein